MHQQIEEVCCFAAVILAEKAEEEHSNSAALSQCFALLPHSPIFPIHHDSISSLYSAGTEVESASLTGPMKIRNNSTHTLCLYIRGDSQDRNFLLQPDGGYFTLPHPGTVSPRPGCTIYRHSKWGTVDFSPTLACQLAIRQLPSSERSSSLRYRYLKKRDE